MSWNATEMFDQIDERNWTGKGHDSLRQSLRKLFLKVMRQFSAQFVADKECG